MILDIAFPRDFDPRIGGLDQVMLYHVDELRAQAEQNRLSRQKGIDPALAIIERETAVCCAQLRHQRDVGLLLQQLGNHADQIRQRELTRFIFQPARLDGGRPRSDRTHGDAASKTSSSIIPGRRYARP